jgi:hypothetical protein
MDKKMTKSNETKSAKIDSKPTFELLKSETLPKNKTYSLPQKIDCLQFDVFNNVYHKQIEKLIAKNSVFGIDPKIKTYMNFDKNKIFNLQKIAINDSVFISAEMLLNINNKSVYANCIYFSHLNFNNKKFDSKKLIDSFINSLLEKNAKNVLSKNVKNLQSDIKKYIVPRLIAKNPANKILLNVRYPNLNNSFRENVISKYLRHLMSYSLINVFDSKLKNTQTSESAEM